MLVSAADTDALICAFRLSPNGALGLEALELLPSIEQPLWLHFNVLDNRTRRYLEKLPDLDEEGRAMLLGSDTRIQARVLEDGFIVILGDLQHDFNLDPEAFGTLRVYMTRRAIVTCRRQRMRSVDRVRRELESVRDDRSPLDVFSLLLDEIVEGFVALAADLGERVENLQIGSWPGTPASNLEIWRKFATSWRGSGATRWATARCCSRSCAASRRRRTKRSGSNCTPFSNGSRPRPRTWT